MAQSIDQLRKQLEGDMENIYYEAAKIGYYPTRYMDMIKRKGAMTTALELIRRDGGSSGFSKLWDLKRLDLSVEALVVSGKYDLLFSKDDIEICRQRLSDYGYTL